MDECTQTFDASDECCLSRDVKEAVGITNAVVPTYPGTSVLVSIAFQCKNCGQVEVITKKL